MEDKEIQVFDRDIGEITMCNQWLTDYKGNWRIVLPKARPAKDEAELMVKKKVLDKYVKHTFR